MATKKGIYKILNAEGTYDTIYLQTDSSQVLESTSKQFVSSSDKTNWNSKANSVHKHTSNDITDATDANTAGKIIKRDANGDFSARNMNGNALTATKLQTIRKINGVNFDGTSDITITATPTSHHHDDLYKRKTMDYKITPKLLADKQDLNLLYESGHYASDSDANSATILNRPPGNTGFSLEVRTIYGAENAAGRTIQIATMRISNDVYVRNKSENSSWTNWIKQWNASNLTFGTGSENMARGNHTHNYLPLTGGIVNGTITSNVLNVTDQNGYKHNNLGVNDNHVIGVQSGIIYLGNLGAKTQIEANVNPTVKIGSNIYTMYHTGNKPSAADVGAAASNHNHDSSYLKLTGGTVSGDIFSTGIFAVSSGDAITSFRFLNDVASIRYGGAGAGSANGFNIVGSGDNIKLRIDENGELYARGTQKVYHVGNKPSYSDVGAAAASHNHNSSNITALTGYSKPSETSAIAASDSLNSALGKLEKGLEGKKNASWTPKWSEVTEKPTVFTPAPHVHSSSDVEKMTGYKKGNTAAAIVATDTLNAAISKLEVALDGKEATHSHPYRSDTWVPTWNDVTGKPTIISINDSATTTTNQTWSAKKIYDSLAGKAESSHTHTSAQISDATSVNTANTVVKRSANGLIEVSSLNLGNNEVRQGGGDNTALVMAATGGNVYLRPDKNDTSKELVVSTNTITFNGNKVYHAGNKPSLDEIGAAAKSHNHTSLSSVTKIAGAGASGPWGSIDIGGSKASWAGFNFSDMGYSFLVNKDGYTGVWKNGGNAVFAFNESGALANGTVGWDKITGKPSTLPPSAPHANSISGSNNTGVSTANDANKIWKSGFYETSNGTNYPSSGSWYWLIHAGHTSNNSGGNYQYGMQITAQNGTNNFYIRTTNNVGVGTWNKLYHTGNKPTLTELGITTLTKGSYLTGSNYNGTAATTWSVDATTTATANKVVARDTNADVSARSFKSNLPVQNDISGAIAFRVNNSDNDYIRFCSDTGAIRTFLNTYAKNDTYNRNEMDNRYRQKTDLVFTDTISIITPAA